MKTKKIDFKNIDVKWKDAARIKANAGEVYLFLEKISEKNNGVINIDMAVNESRKKTAPLHNELEWDDKIAGHEYRKTQVKYIIRHITIVRKDLPAPMRAYETIKVEHVSNDDEAENKTTNVFMKTEDILSSPAGREQLLHRAMNDAIAFKRRYSALSELSKIIRVIDDEIDILQKSMLM